MRLDARQRPIDAGSQGTTYAVGGSYFALLLSSETVNVEFFNGKDSVGAWIGTIAGPAFQEEYTSFIISTVSGAAGWFYPIISDVPVNFHGNTGTVTVAGTVDVAGTVNIVDTVSPRAQLMDGNEFAGYAGANGVTAKYGALQIKNIHATRSMILKAVEAWCAAAGNLYIGTYTGTDLATVVGTVGNRMAGGAAPAVAQLRQDTMASNAPPGFSPLKKFNLPASQATLLEFENRMWQAPPGTSLLILDGTPNDQFNFNIDWQEV